MPSCKSMVTPSLDTACVCRFHHARGHYSMRKDVREGAGGTPGHNQ